MTRQLPDDAALCAALTRRHARTFALASRFLPEEKRRAAFAVYAFCRVADDLVDEPASDDPGVTRRALERHRAALADSLRGRPSTASFRELSWAARRFGIPHTPMHELLNALLGDIDPVPVQSWDQLARYCAGVASTVGTMCAHVFGLPADPEARGRALRGARALGVAMQLTNILRDVGEDAARGRCYLPADELAAFGLTRDEVLARAIPARDPRWRALMMHEVARARALYAAAEPALALVPHDARCCALICARGYASILDAIERCGYDCLHHRARAGTATKLATVLRAWRESRRPAPGPRAIGRRGRAGSSIDARARLESLDTIDGSVRS